MTTDPIADMLTRLRNANVARHEKVEIPGSKVKRALAEILKREGFIRDFEWIEDSKQGVIRVYLKYTWDKKKALTSLRRVSRPGLRVYVNRDRLPRVLRGMGIAVISTSKGILTDREARERKIGGEVLCYIW